MRIVIDVTTGEAANRIRHATDPWDDVRGPPPKTYFLRRADGKLETVAIGLEALRDVPPYSILDVRTEPTEQGSSD